MMRGVLGHPEHVSKSTVERKGTFYSEPWTRLELGPATMGEAHRQGTASGCNVYGIKNKSKYVQKLKYINSIDCLLY